MAKLKSTFRVMAVQEGGSYFVPVLDSKLKSLGWNDGDEVKIELVVARSGKVSHIVVERKD